MQIDATPGHSGCAPAAPKAAGDPRDKAINGTTPPLHNPANHIDPGLGIIITQYLSADGGLTAQYPTQQVIARYEIYGISKTGPN